MKAGLLTEMITIDEPVLYTEEYGNDIVEWEYVCNTRAHIIYSSGSRINENQEIFYPNNVTFIVRDYVNVREPMRIHYKDKFYQIISIRPSKEYYNKEIYTELVNE